MAIIGNFDKVLEFVKANAEQPLVKLMLERSGLTIDDIQSYDDFIKIKPLSKEDLSAIQSVNPPLNSLVDMNKVSKIFQSPGPIYNVKGEDFEHYRFYKALEMAGFSEDDIVVNTFSYHISPAGEMFDDALRKIGATIFPLGPTGSESAAEFAANIEATAFIGTRTFLLKTLEQLGNKSKINKAYLIAEKLTETDRKMFKNDFAVLAYQGYGTAELGLIATEDKAVNGMIVDTDAIFLEIVEPLTGNPVGATEQGEVVVTFMNKTTPFVRLATGDLSNVQRFYTDRIEGIFGRADNSVKIKGVFVHYWQFEKLANYLESNIKLVANTDEKGMDYLQAFYSTDLQSDILIDKFKAIFGLKLSSAEFDYTVRKIEIIDIRKRLKEK